MPAVNREHLLQMARQVNRVSGIGKQPAVLTFSNGEFQIALGGCSFCADAVGEWPGQVKVSVPFIRRLKTLLPTGDGPVVIEMDGESLNIGGVKIKCEWDRLVYPRIELPLGAALLDHLVLPLRYSPNDIERSNLMEVVEAAENKRDKLVQKAARTLQPFGIQEDDIQELVDSCLRKRIEGETSGPTFVEPESRTSE